MPEPISFNPEPISTACFLNPCHQSVCRYVCLPFVARQRLCKNVTAENNTLAKIQVLFDASFSVHSVSYKRKVRDYCYKIQFQSHRKLSLHYKDQLIIAA
jgi:hypothetical protein